MQFIIDNLIGVVIGSVVLLLMAALHLRTQDENIDALRSETNRARLIDLVHVVERDLRNAGSEAGETGVIAWSGALPTGPTPVTVMEFVTTVDTSATARPKRVRYDLARAGEAQIEGETVSLFELRRLAYDDGSYTPLSVSTPTLTGFELILLDSAGLPTTTPAAARAFMVHTTTLSPFGADKLTKDSRWETIIWPVNLNI